MNDRSILRLRQRPHIHPDRREETIVEVLRDGEVVATIYGSREGVHITSERFAGEQPLPLFLAMSNVFPQSGWVLSLLADQEDCPWCHRASPTCALCASHRRHGKLSETT